MNTRSVRLPDEIDADLIALAEAEHSSVNSLLVRAAQEMITHRRQETAVSSAADKVFARRAGLFGRLADT
jgi:predicted transcriptional regulator